MDVLQGRYTNSLSATKHFEFQLHCSPCVYTNKWICISEKVSAYWCICVSPHLHKPPLVSTCIINKILKATAVEILLMYIALFIADSSFLKYKSSVDLYTLNDVII